MITPNRDHENKTLLREDSKTDESKQLRMMSFESKLSEIE